MHKRTTPKIFSRAKELHRNMSPAEAELWKHLRAHRMGDVHFRNHTAPAVGAGDMPLIITLLTFALLARNLSLNWTAVSTWNRQNTMKKEQNTLKRMATESCGFGIMLF
jgi:hypothetical protein